MYPSEQASLKSVKEALGDVDSICERCMLRFAGIKNSRVHLAVAATSADRNGKDHGDDGDETPAAKRQRLSTPCRVCLGILQV